MSVKTKLLDAEDGKDEAITLLQAGECVALPTETVYGLAADASNDDAVTKIFAAKDRPSNHPLIVHVPGPEHLLNWAIDVPELAFELADYFWPGPLTLLLKKAPQISTVVTGGRDTIALRVPEHPLFLDILSESGLGLAAPSANRYKRLSPTTAGQVFDGMQGRISAVLDGGPCAFGLESTIVDLTVATPAVLRTGPITRESLMAATGLQVEQPDSHNVAVPGNVTAHYQPDTLLRVLTTQSLASNDNTTVCYLIYSATAAQHLSSAGVDPTRILTLPDSAAQYAKSLYASLHQLDAGGFREIRVEPTPNAGPWAAVYDRLQRAQGS